MLYVSNLIQHNSQCLIWDIQYIIPSYNHIQYMNSVYNLEVVSTFPNPFNLLE